MERILESRDLLAFSDVMEGLHNIDELDLVPKEFVDYMKQDHKKSQTVIEYSKGLVCVIEKSLLVYYESMAKYYELGFNTLKAFFDLGLANAKHRVALVTYAGNKAHVLDKCTVSFKESSKERREGLHLVDITSRLMMCYNGELNMAFNARVDLIALGQIADFEKELALLKCVHKKFKKSSIAFHYRKVVFTLFLSDQIEKQIKRLSTGGKKELQSSEKDKGCISALKAKIEQEWQLVEHLCVKHPRSYKIYEYMVFFSQYVFQQLMDLEKLPGIPEDCLEALKEEVKLMRIELFLALFEKAKELVKKNVHNHCSYPVLAHLIWIVSKLEIDEFLDDKDFYEKLLKEHKDWVEELLSYYNLVYSEEKSSRSSLESLKEHRHNIHSWNAFCRTMDKQAKY